MKEITPKHLRCFAGACPAVFDVTPEHLKCHMAECPSVSKIGDGMQLLIIGRRLTSDEMSKVQDRIGPDERALVIAAEYFPGLTLEDEQP